MSRVRAAEAAVDVAGGGLDGGAGADFPRFSSREVGISWYQLSSVVYSRLELGPQQKIILFAWLVENKGTPQKAKK